MGDFEIIYDTKGKAREYAPLGVELYTGCRLGCRYCFVSKLRNITIEQFHNDARPVENAISKLESDAKRLKARQDDREILLCFESDPYQFPNNEKQHITREAIEILKEYGLRFTILTKAGFRGTYDFDLLKGYKKASFGTTIIFTDQGDAKNWEPDAANINFRIKAIEMAREKDIKTWVSIEPVIDPKQALELIKKYHPIVDHWKIGKINYHPEIEVKVDWIRFREEVKSLLGSLGADYYLKKSLTDFTDPDSQKKDIKMATKTGTPIVEGKITKPESPLSGNGIKIIPGNKRILLIAPHGVMGDDDNTDILTFEVRKRLECYAIVNDVFQRDIMNFNSFASASSHPEFIKTIKEVADTPGYTLVVWIHGIKDTNAHKEAKAKGSGFNGEPKDLRALIGYGQGPNPMVPPKARTNEDKKSSPTASKKTTTAFHDLLINKGMPTMLTRDKAKKYRGREPDNMNQWFLKEGYNFEQVESLQLEIRETPTRLKENIAATAEIIANTLSELVPLVKEVAEAIDEPLAESITVPEVLDEVEDKVDDVLVDRAYQWLADRFRKHITNFVIEAGRYMIDTFYEGNPRAAFAKNKTKEQPPSLKRLMEKIQQTSNSPSESAPSTGWLYNAVNLAAHEAICKQEGFQTFGILGHSHKLQLLHVPKLKQIEIDKFNEAIKPAFQEKERLASVAVEKKLSVRGFKAYINEQHPDDSGTIDLTKLPSLSELRQRESKELLRLWNLAKSKIDEGQKMMGIYSTAIHKLGIVLAETNTNAELGKGRFQDWTKSKNNVNICTGCKNDCVYCYMKPMNAGNPKLKQPEDWHNWELRQDDVDKNYGLRDGLVGFPSSHDIFPDILDASLSVLGKILRAGNEVLIVSKPRLECIKAICAASLFFKDKILFRFTIGAMSDEILSYWEPNSPTYDERKECLEYVFHNGFQTSVSMEPMLDSPNIEALVKDLLPFVSEDIWFGTMNHLGWIRKGADKRLFAELDIIEAGQTSKMLLAIDKIYENNPIIKWKTDALKIIERAKEKRKVGISESRVKRCSRNRQYELKSALQKSIRLCEVNESRYFARELMDAGYPGGVLKQLILIAAEDVGLADPSLIVYEKGCLDSFDNLIKQYKIKKREACNFPELCNIVDRAVIAAAISYKSRLLPQLSFATLFDIYEKKGFSKNLSEYLDRFEVALKKRDEKQSLYYAYILGIFLISKNQILEIIQKHSGMRNQHLIHQWVEEYKRDYELLMLVGSVVLLCRDLGYPHGEYNDFISQHLSLRIKKAEIPDRAYDRHTSVGKRMGRDFDHFFDEAATVKNERFPNDWEQAGRTAYKSANKEGFRKTAEIIMAIKKKNMKNITKIIKAKGFIIQLPFDYKDAVLTQARTRRDGPYAFIVELNDGSRKFMKGRFKNAEDAEGHLVCNEVKRSLASKYLHPIQCEIKEYDSHLVFLECEELGKADLDKVTVPDKPSKLDGEFIVLDYVSNDFIPDPFTDLTGIDNKNRGIWIEVMVNYCFRWVFGIADEARRNLMFQRSTGKIYSTDETGIEHVSHKTVWGGKKPNKKVFKLVREFIESKHLNEVLIEVKRWKKSLDLIRREVVPLSKEVEGRIDKLLNNPIIVFDI